QGMFEEGRAPDADPKVVAVLQRLHSELERSGMRAEIEALRQRTIADRQSDGMLDSEEGKRMTEGAHELGLHQMSFLASCYAKGIDPAAIYQLQEKLRNYDAAASLRGREGDTAEHRDHTGGLLKDMRDLTPEEIRLHIESQALRYDDLHAGYTTSSGRQIE